MNTIFNYKPILLIFALLAIAACSKENNPVAAPVAEFDFTVDDAEVIFTNKSTGGSLTYSWDFGDGSSSQDKNPVHTYAAGGTYNITLTVTNGGGSNSSTKQIQVAANRNTLIARKWRIKEAYGNGNPDPGTQGKTLEFNSNGTYTFDGSFSGNWKFTNSQMRVLLDEGQSFEQDWEILMLTSSKFDVKFISPFDGSNLQWVMEPF